MGGGTGGTGRFGLTSCKREEISDERDEGEGDDDTGTGGGS